MYDIFLENITPFQDFKVVSRDPATNFIKPKTESKYGKGLDAFLAILFILVNCTTFLVNKTEIDLTSRKI